jgi:hypothetical protein
MLRRTRALIGCADPGTEGVLLTGPGRSHGAGSVRLALAARGPRPHAVGYANEIRPACPACDELASMAAERDGAAVCSWDFSCLCWRTRPVRGKPSGPRPSRRTRATCGPPSCTARPTTCRWRPAATTGALPYGADADRLRQAAARPRRLTVTGFRACTDEGGRLDSPEVIDLALDAIARATRPRPRLDAELEHVTVFL